MTERFILQPSQDEGFWVATDKEKGIVVKFEEHKFNETQQTTLLEDADASDFMGLARAMQELGDWLSREHYSVAMPVPENVRLRIGLRIRELRTAQHLSQEDLAQMAGITRANLSNIEAGKYSAGLDILNKIATALGAEINITTL